MVEKTVGEAATEILIRATAMRWAPPAVERVTLWSPVLAKAYDAVHQGFPDQNIHVPSHIGDVGGKDLPAGEVLRAFDVWLGRGIVWHSLDFVSGWDDEL